MLSINLSDMDVAREGGAFELIKPGKHHAYVSSVEVTESKSSGKPMLVVEWTVDGDDSEAGKTVLDRTVFTIKSKRTGKEQIHFNLPKYFGAAGQWPSNPAELKAKLSPAQIDSTVQRVASVSTRTGSPSTRWTRTASRSPTRAGMPSRTPGTRRTR